MTKVVVVEERWCEAKTRRQMEAASWGDSKVGCNRHATILLPSGHWVCWQHADAPYGFNW